MKKKLLFTVLTGVLLFGFPFITFSQAPNAGIISSFVLYTTTGAVGNIGTSQLTGNVGNQSGSITGLGASNVTGTIYNAVNAVTKKCTADLSTLYNNLNTTPVNKTSASTTSFGNGETLYAGVYSLLSSGTLDGTLTLDAQSQQNAVFIFKVQGAFNPSVNAKIVLINGASACNIFWVAEGALSIGGASILKGTFIAHTGAITVGAGCNIEGSLISTTGAINVTSITAFLPKNCVANYWTAAAGTTDWNTPNNWSVSVPDSLSATIIPTLAGNNIYPVITSGIRSVNTLTIQNSATLSVNNATLQIKGIISNNGNFDASNGTIEMNGTTAQIIPANTFAANSVQNLIIGNNVSLAGPQYITGKLSFGGNNFTCSTGDNLTFRSTASGTAQLADITNGGINKGNIISGKVIIERYIPAKRAWVLLAAPIASANASTINAAWQEGVTSGNPAPGYGVQITGGTTANGFDQGSASPSLKYYNSSNNTFVGLPAVPGTNAAISSYPGYFLFVRGDRSTSISQGANAVISNTTLRLKGQVNTGNTTIAVGAQNFTLVGNPYPAAIDFHTLSKTNVSDQIYLWDPQLTQSGFGGYVTLIWNTNTNQYDATSSTSPLSQYIASGTAFFVQSADGINPGTVTIKETDKTNNGNDNVFRPMSNPNELRVNLSGIKTTDNSTYLLDGVLTTYADNNSNAVDKNDAKKLYGTSENISIGRENKMLAIERRQTINTNDTTFLKLYTLGKKNYKLTVTTTGMDSTSLYGIIKDNYAAANNNMVVNMGRETNLSFIVNSDSASFAPDRFSIIFSKLTLLPVEFISVNASAQQKNIVVTWKTATENNIKRYEIETSANAINFITSAVLPAVASSGGSASYTWLDINAKEGEHYYRIKSIDNNNVVSYSTVVNVAVASSATTSAIAVFGNSLQDNKITVQFNNIAAGKYSLQLYTMQGVLITKLAILHDGTTASSHVFTVNNNLPGGKYFLQLSNQLTTLTTTIIKE